MSEAAYRVTVTACARCGGTGIVPIGAEDPRRCAVAQDEAGQVFAAFIGCALHYEQCSQCLGTGGWTMDSHEAGKP